MLHSKSRWYSHIIILKWLQFGPNKNKIYKKGWMNSMCIMIYINGTGENYFAFFLVKIPQKKAILLCYITVNKLFVSIVISSSCRTTSMDIPDPFSPPFSIVHCFRLVFKATSCISTELLYVGSSWLSCLCLSMWGGPQEYVTYEFALTFPAVSRMSGSSNLDSFRDEW